MTADKNENESRELKFGKSIKFSVYIKIPVDFFPLSCHQPSTAVNSWLKVLTADKNKNQPRELKFGTLINFTVYMNIPVNFLPYQPSYELS